MNLQDLLQQAIARKASDLHLVVGIPPTVRVHGELSLLGDEKLTPSMTRAFIYDNLTAAQRETFDANWELDFALPLSTGERFRVNVYLARGHIEAAFRSIAIKPPHLSELNAPPVVAQLCRKTSGLVLITGPAGQGKTTTMAAMVNQINQERHCRIITIEDPIEYLHQNVNSVVIQREVGSDTKSFHGALVEVLRQDPDVICIGEMRDRETIGTALTAAETGHLVMATLHTPDAPQCMNRIVDVFPGDQQDQIRLQLASTLEAVIGQQLLPRVDGLGRMLVAEIVVATTAVRSLIRDNRVDQLYTVMETGAIEGMMTRDRILRDLMQKSVVTPEVALAHARHPQALRSDV